MGTRRAVIDQGAGLAAFVSQQDEPYGSDAGHQLTMTAAATAKRRGRLRRRNSSQSSLGTLEPPQLVPQRQLVVHKPDDDFNSNFGIQLTRTEASFLGGLMGMARRSEITGEIYLKGGVLSGEKDFGIADFWTRDMISGLPSQLAQDHYLFRVIPLTYRTWMYHHSYNSGSLDTKPSKARAAFDDVDDIIGHVLEQNCIDVPVSAGRWSPAMCYIPATMVAVLTADVIYIIAIGFIFVFIVAASRMMNTPQFYRYIRLTTLPLRFGFLIFTILQAVQEQESRKLVGFLLVVASLLVDLLAGDLGQVLDFKHTCSYEVVRSLANRVYICKRTGAGYTKLYVERPHVDEFISGIGQWDHTYVLLCDLMGIVVELQPMQLKDWVQIMDSNKASETVHFISLNVYSDACPSAYSLAGAATVPNTPQKPPTMPDLPNSVPPELPPLSKSALFK
mmetsp:Transcript_18107/g.42004  ORF Transcript_18107/g.42004 Transcript_18107/m.42004 type:complete len:448 (+) Transcript_18107:74-1417(+)